MGTFQYLDHSADLMIHLEAATPSDLFSTAGRALMEWMGPTPPALPEFEESVAVEAEGYEELLVRWLQELLYLFHQKHAYLLHVSRIKITENKIEAGIQCRRWDESCASDYQEVKAITYHKLRVHQSGEVWQAKIILDI
jgi:SHS2 domain-containing protein